MLEGSFFDVRYWIRASQSAESQQGYLFALFSDSRFKKCLVPGCSFLWLKRPWRTESSTTKSFIHVQFKHISIRRPSCCMVEESWYREILLILRLRLFLCLSVFWYLTCLCLCLCLLASENQPLPIYSSPQPLRKTTQSMNFVLHTLLYGKMIVTASKRYFYSDVT